MFISSMRKGQSSSLLLVNTQRVVVVRGDLTCPVRVAHVTKLCSNDAGEARTVGLNELFVFLLFALRDRCRALDQRVLKSMSVLCVCLCVAKKTHYPNSVHRWFGRFGFRLGCQQCDNAHTRYRYNVCSLYLFHWIYVSHAELAGNGRVSAFAMRPAISAIIVYICYALAWWLQRGNATQRSLGLWSSLAHFS